MSNFIPRDENKARLLEEHLSTTPFNSSKNFVDFYNSGIINKRNPEVVKVLDLLSEAYKDIDEKSGKIVFLSKAEIMLDETFDLLAPWTAIVKLKREVQQGINDGVINGETVVAFIEGQNQIHYATVDEDTNEEVFVALGVERVLKPEFAEKIFTEFSSIQQRDENSLLFVANDFLSIDDSFIENVYNALPQ